MTEMAAPLTVASAMFNPPFIGSIVVAAADGYAADRDGEPLPFALPFVVVPMVLDARTRRVLPNSVTTHMVDWIGRHPQVRAAFPERASSLTAVVRAGIRWVLRVDAARVEAGGLRAVRSVRTGARARRLLTGAAEPIGLSLDAADAADVVSTARLVGRWLTKNENVSTTFALLGVRP